MRSAIGDRHQLGGRQHARHAFAQRGDRRRGYVRPAEDFEELLLGRGGFEQAVMVFDPADDEERQGILLKGGADEDVGVDDQPHPARGSTSF
jgi:hypothetical protein